MLKLATRSISFIAVLGMLLAVVVVNPNPAHAASGNPAYCDSEVEPLTNPDIQDKVPVILVYGFKGKTDDWGLLLIQRPLLG